MNTPFVIAPGEPNLLKTLLKAARTGGARYVHQYAGVTGWHMSDVVPRSIPVYFRVAGQKVWIRNEAKAEILVAKVVSGELILEESAKKFLAR